MRISLYSLLVPVFFIFCLVSGFYLTANDNVLFISSDSSLKGFNYYFYSIFVSFYYIFGPLFCLFFLFGILEFTFKEKNKIFLIYYFPGLFFLSCFLKPSYSFFLGEKDLSYFFIWSSSLTFIVGDFLNHLCFSKKIYYSTKTCILNVFSFLKTTHKNKHSGESRSISNTLKPIYSKNPSTKMRYLPFSSKPNPSAVNATNKHVNTSSSHKTLPSRVKDINCNDYENIVDFFSTSKRRDFANEPSRAYFDDITSRIEEKLKDFKINGEIINILKGPVVDTFELELGSGVKVSKITSSAEDLSLALLGAPLRIVYPMKGRTTVGIEVPRNPRDIIFLDQLVNSKEFKDTKHCLPLAMGKDAFGDPLIVDLAAMPHMLVAGSTGAGKSVFINSVLISLLIKLDPSKLKLILIDPKQLELALYSKLPHLIMPVVTDASKASTSLLWAVQEMERRYSIMKTLGVRNLEGYNDKIKSGDNALNESVSKFFDGNDYELPYIVVIVDEFADLILTKSGKEIETNICRLAAKARASGIHLIIATQRPSVDVITGLIKSNFPTRVSFRVTSSVDSRTILNSVGAERLLGKGDMLYKHGVETLRCHSSFVDELEIEKLTNRLAELSSGFDPAVIDFLENGGDLSDSLYGSSSSGYNNESSSDGDELYGVAVKLVAESRAASASMLQRRLKVGYNRAANLIEKMEDNGVVGPAQGSKPRKVLVDSV